MSATQLLSGVFRNLKGDEKALKESEATLRTLLTDWEGAYREIDALLSQNLRLNTELRQSNDKLTAQIADLRAARDLARADAYAAMQRVVDLETELLR